MFYQAIIHTPVSGSYPYAGVHRDTLDLANEEELQHVEALCKDPHNMAGFLKATVVPIRTDHWDVLTRDLFFPTLCNFSLPSTAPLSSYNTGKIHSVSTAALLLLSILWDIATLPIRLLTLIPRVVYNNSMTPSEHPLQVFLREKGIPITNTTGYSTDRGTFSDPQEIAVSIIHGTKTPECVKYEGNNYSLAFWDREMAFPQSGGGGGFGGTDWLKHTQRA